jgi:hypothetical protein
MDVRRHVPGDAAGATCDVGAGTACNFGTTTCTCRAVDAGLDEWFCN